MELELVSGETKKKDYGANVKGLACTRIVVDLFEFLEYASEHGDEKAVRYLRLELMPRIMPEGGSLYIGWTFLTRKDV